MSDPLSRVGYSAFFEEQMATLPPDLQPARVIGQHRREWDVSTGEHTERAVLAGRGWNPEKGADAADTQPTVGDWVAIRKTNDTSPPVIEAILTRRTELTRTSAAKRGARQTLVANIDHVAVVAAFAHQDAHDAVAKRSLHPRRIERYLTAIRKGGAAPLVVLNKSDLKNDVEKDVSRLQKRLKKCPVIPVNCTHKNGLLALMEHIHPGETIGFVGLSGVGKSSIVNRLLGREAQKIGAERHGDSRGRHTTTHRELFMTEGGLLLIDTPGMREFAIAGATEADLAAFTDIAEFSAQCQFRDCSHREEPGCRVVRAVTQGELELDRLESFLALALELNEAARTTKVEPRRKGNSAKKTFQESRHRATEWRDEE